EASKKTRSAKNAKAKAGQFIAAKAPFGYKLDPNDRHHLIVDEPAAEIVRRIFTLASQGNGFTRIAKILREEKVLTPITYFNQNNPDYYKSDYWRQEFDWHCESVRVIINNEVYLGKLVYVSITYIRGNTRFRVIIENLTFSWEAAQTRSASGIIRQKKQSSL
ncbi:MAG TPA: hypothetical protein DDX72_06965, partial [Ruminococcaceae bacterium]|nr:hypothetical protein [Oscillospiraceae bacterium]